MVIIRLLSRKGFAGRPFGRPVDRVVAMQEFADWSVGLGRWKGVPVRIHLLFVLFAVLLLILGKTQATYYDVSFASSTAIAVLLLSLAAHELAHLVVAKRLGGFIHEVVIGPFGGLVRPSVPDLPRAHLLVALAGPLANLACSAIAATVLLAYYDEPVMELLSLFAPANLIEGLRVVVVLKLAVWLNWLLALINFLPVFPFDGAVAYRDALREKCGGRAAAVYVARIGFLTSLALLGLAWWAYQREASTVFPVWPAVVCAAVFVAFSAQRDCRRFGQRPLPVDHGAEPADPEDDEEIDFIEDHAAESLALSRSWHSDSASDEQAWQAADDEAEEAQLDAVLARLHHCGIEALSAEERQLLERASLRYRSRRQKRSAEDAS